MAGERLDVHNYNLLNGTVIGHRFRYFLAGGFVQPGDRVLDLACGTGYGADILAKRAHQVTALDRSHETIEGAKRLYPAPNITFLPADLDTWEPTPEMCEVAVSFETIEHLKGQPEVFAGKLKKAAVRAIVVSAPIIPTVGINPYHLHDFTDDDMVRLFVDDEWALYEKVKQRVYGIYVFVRKSRAGEMI